jgi:hypothetical protein
MRTAEGSIIKNIYLKSIAALAFTFLLIGVSGARAEDTKARAEDTKAHVWIAGNYWVDVAGVDKGQPLRLWMAFYRMEPSEAEPGETPISGELTMEELRLGSLALYAGQMEALKPDTVLDADELAIYVVDPQFENPLPLADWGGTLDDLWLMAKGQTGPSALDRTFENRVNPLGILRQSFAAYIRRTLTAAGAPVDDAEVLEQAKQMQASQARAGDAMTGFILLLAPKDQTSAPSQVEVRRKLSTDAAALSRKRPAGHTQSPIEGIAAASEQISQVRIKSGVFLDIRLYNGAKQLTFRQKTGSFDGGLCIDLIVYGKPGNFKNFSIGATSEAYAKLSSFGVREIHIRIAAPESSSEYAEYWMEVDMWEGGLVAEE